MSDPKWERVIAACGHSRPPTEAEVFADLPIKRGPSVAEGGKPFLPCYSASGTAFMLRQIVNRGALQPGDLDAIHAACVLLERAAAEGRI
jgi:hypothetical protein